MRYWPVPSVTTVRTFSVNAGLDRLDGDAGQDGSGRIPDDAGNRGLRERDAWKDQHRGKHDESSD